MEKALEASDEARHLVFTHHGSTYAVGAGSVAEIVMLPELKCVEEAPPFIAGVFDLRGRIVPVIDLDLRFGHRPLCYRLSDFVIVMEAGGKGGKGGKAAGVIVNGLLDVREIPPSVVEAPLQGADLSVHRPRFIKGEAMSGGEVVMVLDAESLLLHTDLPEAPEEEPETPLTEHSTFLPGATSEERGVLNERAAKLAEPILEEGPAGRMSLAVMLLNGERFAITLDSVKEFAELKDITPAPSAPERIIGNMNLRGEILTVVDIREALGMPVKEFPEGAKVVVVDLGGAFAGVAAEDIGGIIHVRPSEIKPPPVSALATDGRFVKGAFLAEGGPAVFLDVLGLFLEGGLVVDETP